MAQLFEFLSNHHILGMAFFVLLGTLIWTFIGMGGSHRLEPVDVTRLINHEDAVVIDVRGDGEFSQGHIVNAVHVPYDALAEQLDKLEKYRDRPIVTACRTGQQSATASGVLRKRGFEKVYSLSGGIAAWEGANLPLTKQ